MLNLLPPTEKKKIRNEYYARLFAVALAFSACTLLIGIILVISEYIILSSKEKSFAQELSVMENRHTSIVESEAMIQGVNKQLTLLKRKNSTYTIYADVMERVTRIRGQTKITALFYERGQSGAETLRIVGVAPTREELARFVKILKETEPFAKVNAPVSNFVKERDLEFSLQITLREQATP